MTRPISARVTVIGRHKCSCCGSPQEVKTNKNGRAYFFCRASDPDGAPCNAEHKLSPYVSARMVATYRNEPETANDNGPPQPQKIEKQGGSFFV